MSRNVESRFALAPSMNIQRSRFKLNNSVKTSFNVGDIVPFYLSEVLPGDTFDVRTSKVVRLQTPLTPIMDNMYLDTYFMFVPNRLVWKHWKEMMGENTESAWLPETEYTIPQITSPASTGWNVGSIADYLGLPTGVTDLSVSALPFRAYAKVCDDWFRDENLSDPLLIPDGDSTQTGSNGSDYITDVANGGMPFKASKYHDYFTSCLPSPQKGPDVPIPVVTSGQASFTLAGTAPIKTVSGIDYVSTIPLHFKRVDGNDFSDTDWPSLATWVSSGNHSVASSYVVKSGIATNGVAVYPSNLQADLSDGSATLDDISINAGSINQLRLAFQIQKFYEKDARSGSRYIEVIKSHFGVTSPDARLQRSEYLGGNRIPITINQVVQNSGTGDTPQGTTTAYSLTVDTHGDFKRSFTEHGYVIGVMVVRYDHTYQQGIARHWSRMDRLDFYWPVFANIGEQAVKNKEIYAQGSLALNPDTNKPYDDEVFGYQEAWAEYRFKPSIVTGEMRSAATNPLDSWHLADDYESLPSLSDSWIREDKTNVDRVLAVTSAVSNQVFADIYVQNMATRPMPMFSIPGLMDHH